MGTYQMDQLLLFHWVDWKVASLPLLHVATKGKKIYILLKKGALQNPMDLLVLNALYVEDI